jgi:uncharacterized DUF497 family protein
VAVDWSHRSDYIVANHGVTAEQADEALADPAAVVFDPDYNSKSGESVRTIGDSPSFGDILTVITVEEDGAVYGANAWRANDRDRRYYEQGGPDEGDA